MSLTPSEKSMKEAENLLRRIEPTYLMPSKLSYTGEKVVEIIALALDQREQSVWEEATKIIEEAYRSYNPSKSPAVFVDSLLSARSKSLKE